MPQDYTDWPIAIVQDRYGNSYSDGEWLAMFGEYDSRHGVLFVEDGPDGPSGGDGEAIKFWDDPPDWIAAGQTPEHALSNLLSKKGKV